MFLQYISTANHLHALDITGDDYRNHRVVVGFDTENMLGLAFTGINTNNNLMTIKFKNNAGDYQASRMHIVLAAQQVLEVSDTGITFLIKQILSYQQNEKQINKLILSTLYG